MEGLQKELPFQNDDILLTNVEIEGEGNLCTETIAAMGEKGVTTLGELAVWAKEKDFHSVPDITLELPYEAELNQAVAEEIQAIIDQYYATAPDPELPYGQEATEAGEEVQTEAEVVA